MLIRKSRFWLRAGTKKVVRANYMYIVIIWIIVFIVKDFHSQAVDQIMWLT
jgi:hypothetical protein